MAQARLWHIVISHYSEKARWALDHKGVDYEGHTPPPGFHIPVALWLTRGRSYTFPVLELDGRRYGDSTAIVAALEQRFPAPALYPSDLAERQRALELEDWMDEELAPALRRFVFHEFRRDDVHFEEVVANAAPGLVARLGPAAGRFARLLTGVRYGAASDERADRAREQVVRVLDRLDRELDGREYLAGERFSVADLTTAALLYPLVLPPQAPTTFQQMPEPYERFRESVRHRRSFGWVEEMFRRHR